MLEYIVLKNMIIVGECMMVEEETNVDKKDGNTSVFMKWLQPVGFFELGTTNKIIVPVTKKTPTTEEVETLVNDTSSSKPLKGKGTRKKNLKVKL